MIGTWDTTMQPTNETTQSWICDVDEEGVLIFPDDLWNLLNWKEGDTVEFLDQGDGSFVLQKVEDTIEDTNDTSTIKHA